MTPATRVSLALLWERWQEIEELPEHDKTVLAELNVIEARIIDQPAKNARDLVAKLKFLAHIARDHDWDDKLEKLHASILSAQEDFLRSLIALPVSTGLTWILAHPRARVRPRRGIPTAQPASP
ncbi:MAG: hypothetical protein WB697_03915 [Stellaceae bacterium]